MANKTSKRPSITSFFHTVNIFPFVALIALLAGVSVLAAVYVTTGNVLFLYIMIAYAVLLIALYLIGAFRLSRRFNALFVRGLYSTTVFNLRNITDNENALIDYPNNSYEEFIALNEQVETLKKELDYSTLITSTSDFSHINLDYVDIDNNVVTLRSFKENLEAIIFASQNYRNALVELYYDLNEDTLNANDQQYLITLLNKNFGDYRQLMIVLNENHKSIYLYFPRIDSLSKIREQLESTLKSI